MKATTKVLKAAMIGLSLAALASCHKGSAQKVGERIDNAVQDTKDAAHDVKHDFSKNN